MGEFVTDLDDSYTTEEYVDVPPPPKKVPSSCPGRFIVALPQRAQMDAVSEEQGRALADELGIKFMETSARVNDHVEEAFFTLARFVLHH